MCKYKYILYTIHILNVQRLRHKYANCNGIYLFILTFKRAHFEISRAVESFCIYIYLKREKKTSITVKT